MNAACLEPAEFRFVQELLRRHAGIALEPGKEYLVESRLAPLARACGEEDVPRLLDRVRRAVDASLASAVVEAMTINETSWFRDRAPFDALRDHVLPELMQARRAHQRLTLWSAACSTGQEPYSAAMLVSDALRGRPGWTAEVHASDISSVVLDRARAARYSQLEINRGLPAALLVQHFRRSGTGWQLGDEVRDLVTFRQLNLATELPWPDAAMDVVFLRNVLIYFDVATRRQVLARVRRVLRPDGYLFLGSAETTLHLDDSFERVPLGSATAYRLRPRKAA